MCLRRLRNTTKYQRSLFPDRTSEYEVGVFWEPIVLIWYRFFADTEFTVA